MIVTTPNPTLSRAPLPGAWRLPARRAVTLEPTRHGLLRVHRGRLWLTCNGSKPHAPDSCGDCFLQPGHGMAFGPGHRVVIESCDAAGAVFSWTPVWDGPRQRPAQHRVSAQNPIARLASSLRLSFLLPSTAALCPCLMPPDGES